MKRKYEKPHLQWVAMQSNEPVADICWGYANNGQPFYHDIPGLGYAILEIVSQGGCKADLVFVVEFSNGDQMTATERAAAQAYIDKAIAKAKAESGSGNTSSYKGSPFVADPSPSWS